jgi:hypothetical protein
MVGNVGPNLVYDNSYNRRLIEILKNYEDVQDFARPQAFMGHYTGGTAPREYSIPGDTSYDNEAAFDTVGGKSKLQKVLKTVGQFVKPLGRNLKPVKRALMERAVYEIGKPMYAPKRNVMEYVQEIDGSDGRQPIITPEVITTGGRQNNQRKKGFAKFVRTVGRAVKPLGKYTTPVMEALTSRAVKEIGGRRKKGLAKGLKEIGQFLKPIVKYADPVAQALSRRAVKEIGGKRPPNAWVLHVKDYAAKHMVSYKQAMSEARASYKK